MGGRLPARSPTKLKLVWQRANARCAEYRGMGGGRKLGARQEQSGVTIFLAAAAIGCAECTSPAQGAVSLP